MLFCVNVQTTHENIFDLVDSNGTSGAKTVQETYHLHLNSTLTGVLVNKRILQTRKGGLDGVHAPFCPLPHQCCLLLLLDIQPLLLASWHGWDEIILRRLDEEGSVNLTESRINCSLTAGLIIYGTELIIHPPPMCNLAIMHGSWNIEKGDGSGPVRAKNKVWCHIVTMRPPIVKTSLDLGVAWLLQVQLEPIHYGSHIR